MDRLIAIIFAAFLFVATAHAADADNWSWTKEDTIRQVLATTLTVIDWGQTNDIVERADRVELNPILGPHPSKQAVQNYFLTVLVLQPAIARLLPREATVWGFDIKPRTAWQYLYIGVEWTAIASNFRGGLKIRF